MLFLCVGNTEDETEQEVLFDPLGTTVSIICPAKGLNVLLPVCRVVEQHRCGRHHECGLERVERALPVQPRHQPAGDYPLLETQHGKRKRRSYTDDTTVF